MGICCNQVAKGHVAVLGHTEMYEVLEFLQNYSFDRRVYLVVPDTGGKHFYEILWQDPGFTRGDNFWKFRRREAEEWTSVKALDFPLVAAKAGIDMENLRRQMVQSALNQAVFAETVQAQAQKLFGPHTLQRARGEHQEFLNRLKQLADGLGARRRRKTAKRVINGEGTGGEPRSGHLRLVSE